MHNIIIIKGIYTTDIIVHRIYRIQKGLVIIAYI